MTTTTKPDWMPSPNDTKEKALANLAAHRKLRESADERWERSIAAALKVGGSVQEVAEAAGVPAATVQRIKDRT